MDRPADYRHTLIRLMQEHERAGRASAPPGVETALLADPADGRCLLLRTGWHRGRRVRETYLHARVRDGKVWIEEDGTEVGLANELVAAGVPKHDIVLAFHPPDLRHLTDYAAA